MYISKKKLCIGAAIVVLLLLAVWLVPKISSSRTDTQASSAPKLEIDAAAGEYKAPETKAAESTGIAIPGWGSMTIPAWISFESGCSLNLAMR